MSLLNRSGPEVIKLFSCLTQLSTKFVLLNLKLLTILNSFLLNIAEHENFSDNKFENANFSCSSNKGLYLSQLLAQTVPYHLLFPVRKKDSTIWLSALESSPTSSVLSIKAHNFFLPQKNSYTGMFSWRNKKHINAFSLKKSLFLSNVYLQPKISFGHLPLPI